MPVSNVQTIRPLSVTSDVVLRPTGPLDAGCATELRAAVAYVVARAGGPVVLDCTAVTDVSDEGADALEWFGTEVRGTGRRAGVRHVPLDLEPVFARAGLGAGPAPADGDRA